MDPKKERAQVFVRLHKLRRLIKEMQFARGRKDDIESLRGEVNVLEKELKSFEESGHTTFLQAKKMLQPKKGISGKSHRIKWKRSQIESRIKSLEDRQSKTDLDERERKEIIAKITKFREELSLLDEENSALKEYNHTRFMEAHKKDGLGGVQGIELKEVNKKIVTAETKLEQACGEGNEDLAEELQDDLHLLEMEKESIENFAHDIFLKNLDKMKAKRRSELK